MTKQEKIADYLYKHGFFEASKSVSDILRYTHPGQVIRAWQTFEKKGHN